jgi:hypothetical protein
VNRALELNPNYTDALVYKGLLLRLEANAEKDPKKQADLMKEAVALHDRAEALAKQKAAGVSQPK